MVPFDRKPFLLNPCRGIRYTCFVGSNTIPHVLFSVFHNDHHKRNLRKVGNFIVMQRQRRLDLYFAPESCRDGKHFSIFATSCCLEKKWRRFKKFLPKESVRCWKGKQLFGRPEQLSRLLASHPLSQTNF